MHKVRFPVSWSTCVRRVCTAYYIRLYYYISSGDNYYVCTACVYGVCVRRVCTACVYGVCVQCVFWGVCVEYVCLSVFILEYVHRVVFWSVCVLESVRRMCV